MPNFKTISDACDALLESARNLAESAENMRRAATVGRENAARLDAVKKRLQEALSRNRRIAERMDEVIRSCREARETMKRSSAALRQAAAVFQDETAPSDMAQATAAPPLLSADELEHGWVNRDLVRRRGAAALAAWKARGTPH